MFWKERAFLAGHLGSRLRELRLDWEQMGAENLESQYPAEVLRQRRVCCMTSKPEWGTVYYSWSSSPPFWEKIVKVKTLGESEGVRGTRIVAAGTVRSGSSALHRSLKLCDEAATLKHIFLSSSSEWKFGKVRDIGVEHFRFCSITWWKTVTPFVSSLTFLRVLFQL